MTVRDIDKGAKALLSRLAKAAGVRVGLLEKEGRAPAAKGGGRVTVLDVGTFNEFGTTRASAVSPEHSGINVVWEHIPPRSFIGGWFDEYAAQNEALVSRVMRAVAAGKLSPETAQKQLGSVFKGQIQARMAAGIKPANAQSTIDRKGSSKPLIDTGQLRSSINWAPDTGDK